MIHDFKERLHMSELASDEPFWEAIYKKAFPNFVNMMTCQGDTVAQRQGIDRVIVLSSGKIIKIDEKKREKEYPDILLEYISVDSKNTPGWIEKDLPIDYIAYAFMTSKTVYILPWDLLRRAWCYFKDIWMDKYQHVEARNNGYITHSIAVPIDTLLNSIKRASIIQLED